MVKVKGSKQYSMKVVSYRPWLWRIQLGSLIVVVLMCVWLSFSYGRNSGLGEQSQVVTEVEHLRVELELKTQEAAQYRQSLANAQLGSQVDRQASEGVRGEVISLKEKITALEADISFYRGLMSPSENQQGLAIGDISIVATDTPRSYDYKVVVKQLAAQHQLLSGSLQVIVIGYQGGVKQSMALADLSEDVSGSKINLRFKYFQSVEGRLVLPEGFSPNQINVQATTTGRGAASVEKTQDWQLQ